MSSIPLPAQDSKQGILLICLSATLWGTVGIVAKQIFSASQVDALGAGFYRLVFGLPFALLGCWLLRRGKTLRIAPQDLLRMSLVGLLMAAYLFLYFNSLRCVGVAVSTLLALCTAPVFTALLSILFFKDRISGRFLLSMVLSVGGTILLVHRPGMDLGSGELALGILLALAAAFSYALMVFASRGLPDSYPALLPSLVAFGAGGLALLPFALSGGALPPLTRAAWWWFVYIGAVPTALGYGLFFLGVRTVRPGTTAILTMIEPLSATILAWILFSERLGPRGWAGAALLLSAVWALYFLGQPGTGKSDKP